MVNRRFSFSDNETISCMTVDSSDNTIWIAYEQNSDGVCILEKRSAFDPDLLYFSVEKEVSKIVKMFVSGSYLYLAYEDTTLIGEKLYKTSPSLSPVTFTKPVGITENPVDALISTSIYFLMPGSDSGVNSKIVKFTTSGTYSSTIDLTTVYDATAFDVSGSELWVTTDTNPAQLVRVYNLSSTPVFTVTNIDS